MATKLSTEQKNGKSYITTTDKNAQVITFVLFIYPVKIEELIEKCWFHTLLHNNR